MAAGLTVADFAPAIVGLVVAIFAGGAIAVEQVRRGRRVSPVAAGGDASAAPRAVPEAEAGAVERPVAAPAGRAPAAQATARPSSPDPQLEAPSPALDVRVRGDDLIIETFLVGPADYAPARRAEPPPRSLADARARIVALLKQRARAGRERFEVRLTDPVGYGFGESVTVEAPEAVVPERARGGLEIG